MALSKVWASVPGVLELRSGESKQPLRCVAALAAGVRTFHPGAGDSRSRGISSEYLGTDLCKELRIY